MSVGCIAESVDSFFEPRISRTEREKTARHLGGLRYAETQLKSGDCCMIETNPPQPPTLFWKTRGGHQGRYPGRCRLRSRDISRVPQTK
jgi:hypothetical protein